MALRGKAAILEAIFEKTPLARVATPESVAARVLSILAAPDMTRGDVFAHEGGVTISI